MSFPDMRLLRPQERRANGLWCNPVSTWDFDSHGDSSNLSGPVMITLKGKPIKDECEYCGEITTCTLCREGHGIEGMRMNVVEMLRCQKRHKSMRDARNGTSGPVSATN